MESIEVVKKQSKSKEHHWVPQIYLKSWAVREAMYEFNNKGIKVAKRCNISNILCNKHLYSKKAEDSYILNEDNLDQMIAENLSALDITYEDKKLNLWKDYCEYIGSFDKWIIKKDGRIIGGKHKRKVEHLITYWYDAEIEDLLANKIDDNWKLILGYLTDKILMSKTITKKEEYKKEITQYVIVQYFRTPFHKKLIRGVNETFNIFKSAIKGSGMEEQIDIMKRCHWLKNLEMFLENMEGEQQKEYNYIKQVYELTLKGKFTFLIDYKASFITSDSPVVVIVDDTWVNGIYMALTPQIMLFISNNTKEVDPGHYNIIDVDRGCVARLNRLVVDNSHSKIYFYRDNIKGIVSKEMSKTKYLEYVNEKLSKRGICI